MTEHGLTISEAAAATGVHRTTVVRALNARKFPNATKTGPEHAGLWRIPASDLAAAGYPLLDAAPEPSPERERANALESITGQLAPLLQEITNAQRDAADARAALEVERERHRYALERAQARTSRPEVPTLAAIVLAGYASALYLGALSTPGYLAAALPGGTAVLLALYGAYAASRK